MNWAAIGVTEDQPGEQPEQAHWGKGSGNTVAKKGKRQPCFVSAGLIQSQFLCIESGGGRGRTTGDMESLPPALSSKHPGLVLIGTLWPTSGLPGP